METTDYRTCVRFTKNQNEELQKLQEHFNESASQLIRRGLAELYFRTFNAKEQKPSR